MREIARLWSLLAGHRGSIVLGVLLGFLAVASNIALMAVSAWLISTSALVTNVAEVALAITSVRVLAISRGAFRYLERVVTHRATFAILADLRVWFFASIEPLAPAVLADRRSGDLLARIVADIETLEDFYVRVIAPPLVAILATVFAGLLLGAFDPILSVTLVGFLVLAGVGLPLIAGRSSRRPAQAVVAGRAELGAMLVDEVQGMADLIALDRAADHRSRVLAIGAELDRAGDRLALVRSGTSAVAGTIAGLAAVAVLAIGIGLVGSGRLDGVYLAVLPLVALASFEVIAPLAASFGLQPTTEAAARRLFELTDAVPAVTEPPPSASPLVHPVERGPLGVDVHGLSFRYGPDEPLALDGLDLNVPPGGSLAIVGPSGVGKSTR